MGWSAEQVRPGVRFTDYAVLGDDVIIADEAVAKAYERTITLLGVDISRQKSLISYQGAGEFAVSRKASSSSYSSGGRARGRHRLQEVILQDV